MVAMAPVSACERVCELVLCDGVPHCEKVILQTFVTLVFCGTLEYLHPCSTTSAALRSHCRSQLSHSSLQCHS